MSKEIKIYTCGQMKNLSFEKQMKWRSQIETMINSRTDRSGKRRVKFIHPPLYYCYEKDYQNSEREVMEWELNTLNDCDILIANLDGIEYSIGSHFEIAFAYAMNHFGNKHISVIGINENNAENHPWIEESFLRVEDSLSSAADYIVDYLII